MCYSLSSVSKCLILILILILIGASQIGSRDGRSDLDEVSPTVGQRRVYIRKRGKEGHTRLTHDRANKACYPLVLRLPATY